MQMLKKNTLKYAWGNTENSYFPVFSYSNQTNLNILRFLTIIAMSSWGKIFI